MTQIRNIFLELNPWWKEKYKAEYKEREIYKSIQKYMPLPQIIAFTGLRRVGKTTLMMKIAEDSIGNGCKPENVIYFSFDEFRNVLIRDLLSEYEVMTEHHINDGEHLLLLDEIQKLDNWEDQLKGIYDTHKNKLKIVISGSESLFIRRKSKEILAGRTFEFKVDPLTFKEFLIFKQVDLKPVGIYEKELAGLFGQFILTLGFPELVEIKDKEIIKKYVEDSLVDKIIYRDIPGLYRIKDPSVLESLLNILMEEPGQLMDLSKLAGELKVSRQTASVYLRYLEDSFLVRKLYNFSRNNRKVERKLKKYYPTVVSISLLFKKDDFSRSKIFEWLIVNQLKSEYFWRDPYKNEVDVVIEGEPPQPIEIKYGKIDFKGLLAFMRKFKVNEGLIISYDTEDTKEFNGKMVSVIPAFKHLLK